MSVRVINTNKPLETLYLRTVTQLVSSVCSAKGAECGAASLGPRKDVRAVAILDSTGGDFHVLQRCPPPCVTERTPGSRAVPAADPA